MNQGNIGICDIHFFIPYRVSSYFHGAGTGGTCQEAYPCLHTNCKFSLNSRICLQIMLKILEFILLSFHFSVACECLSIECMWLQGGWALLQNCHLGLNFMDELLDTLLETQQINENFRVWITTEPHNHFPISLLQVRQLGKYSIFSVDLFDV